MKKNILIFGNGYTSKFLIKELINLGWFVYCTSRNECGKKIVSENMKIINFFGPDVSNILKSVGVVLSTVPTHDEVIDPVLERYFSIISQEKFEWIGYLSSTSVYGDHNGKWVDEETKCCPSNFKSNTRLLAEQKWLELYLKYKKPIHIFRLSGIYGPGRNCLEEILHGKDFTVVKKNQYFSRIHVFDICQAIIASIHSPTPGEVYNLSDNEPAPVDVVHQFGASILGKNVLKELSFENSNLSKESKMFFNDRKKVNSSKVIKNLNIEWRYPNYRLGLSEGCLPYEKNARTP